MTEIKWLAKEPTIGFRGKVTGFHFEVSKERNGKTAVNGCAVILGSDQIYDQSYWTDEKIDEYAEEVFIQQNLDENLEHDLADMENA